MKFEDALVFVFLWRIKACEKFEYLIELHEHKKTLILCKDVRTHKDFKYFTRSIYNKCFQILRDTEVA